MSIKKLEPSPLIEKLELRSYSRDEIARLTEVSLKDKNFAAKVKNRLTNWGYEYNYSSRTVEITKIPTTAEERLKELLIRKLNFSVQTDFKAFTIMLHLFRTDRNFMSMPWKTRETVLYEQYGITIADSTMSNWTRRLLNDDVLLKSFSANHNLWRTHIENGIKYQEKISETDDKMAEYKKYNAMRSQLLAEAQEANNTTTCWGGVINKLWNKFHCCYYTVKPIEPVAWYDDDYKEIFSLSEDIFYNLTKGADNGKGSA